MGTSCDCGKRFIYAEKTRDTCVRVCIYNGDEDERSRKNTILKTMHLNNLLRQHK